MIDTLNRRRHARQQAVDAAAMRVELAEGVEHDQVGAKKGSASSREPFSRRPCFQSTVPVWDLIISLLAPPSRLGFSFWP
jgi:hypothetical protein